MKLIPAHIHLCTFALAALPLSLRADVTPLNDLQLEQVSGQTGITLELETQIQVGLLSYTDEGSLNIDDIHLEGALPGTLLDDIKVEIDLLADGDAVVKMIPISGTYIDSSFSFGVLSLTGLTGESSQIASNFRAEQLIKERIYTIDADTGSFTKYMEYAVTDLDVDLDIFATKIRDVTINGANYIPGVTTPNDPDFYVKSEIIFNSVANPRTASGEALHIGISEYSADIHVGAVEIGGKSIGKFSIDDLLVSNTNLQVYGH